MDHHKPNAFNEFVANLPRPHLNSRWRTPACRASFQIGSCSTFFSAALDDRQVPPKIPADFPVDRRIFPPPPSQQIDEIPRQYVDEAKKTIAHSPPLIFPIRDNKGIIITKVINRRAHTSLNGK
jgi:hypothetical protein